MLRDEASSSPCTAPLLIEEDPSLSLRMTKDKFFGDVSLFYPAVTVK